MKALAAFIAALIENAYLRAVSGGRRFLGCCGSSKPMVMRNYSAMWHEGDLHCDDCGAFVRSYDAG